MKYCLEGHLKRARIFSEAATGKLLSNMQRETLCSAVRIIKRHMVSQQTNMLHETNCKDNVLSNIVHVRILHGGVAACCDYRRRGCKVVVDKPIFTVQRMREMRLDMYVSLQEKREIFFIECGVYLGQKCAVEDKL